MGPCQEFDGAEIALKADVKETLRVLIPALKTAGGAALEARARQSVAALASNNWSAAARHYGRSNIEEQGPLADRSGLAGADSDRRDARTTAFWSTRG